MLPRSHSPLRLLVVPVLILLAGLVHDGHGQRSPPLSVHVLDTTNGGNAPGIECRGYTQDKDGEFKLIATSVTNADGRVRELVPAKDYKPGIYRIWLNTKEYFGTHNVTTFWPAIEITLNIRDTGRDHHIPVALSPFGFQTYRGA